jgi:N-acetylneuraminate synthase
VKERKKMKANVIAEIGCNHKGDITIAKELIKTAKEYCNADVAKFQKRNNMELLGDEYNAPHPNPANAYGPTYGAHRDFLEFSLEQHAELKHYCEELRIIYSTSVWDLTSAKEMASLNPVQLKIPSAINTHFDMLGWLCDNYKGELHISVGMTTKAEIKKINDFFTWKKRNKDVVLYSCTSGYPVPFDDICLLEIKKLKEEYGDMVKGIGFSGHHLGVATDIAAYTLGATWVERHFTLDRTWKGTDHAASLEPDGLRRLVRDLHAVEKALTYKEADLLDIEKVQREKLKYRG